MSVRVRVCVRLCVWTGGSVCLCACGCMWKGGGGRTITLRLLVQQLPATSHTHSYTHTHAYCGVFRDTRPDFPFGAPAHGQSSRMCVNLKSVLASGGEERMGREGA